MEASAARTRHTNDTQLAENYLYVSPPNFMAQLDDGKNTELSTINSLGETISDPTPIHGFHFTKCAYQGTCGISDALADERVQRALRALHYDFVFGTY